MEYMGGLKSDHKHPDKNGAELRFHIHERRGGNVATEAKAEMRDHKLRSVDNSPQELGKKTERILP